MPALSENVQIRTSSFIEAAKKIVLYSSLYAAREEDIEGNRLEALARLKALQETLYERDNLTKIDHKTFKAEIIKILKDAGLSKSGMSIEKQLNDAENAENWKPRDPEITFLDENSNVVKASNEQVQAYIKHGTIPEGVAYMIEEKPIAAFTHEQEAEWLTILDSTRTIDSPDWFKELPD